MSFVTAVKRSVRNKRVFLILIMAGCYVIWSVVPVRRPWPNRPTTKDESRTCQRPEMDLKNALITKYLKVVDRLVCGSQDWLTVANGSVWTNQNVEPFSCSLDFLQRTSDFESATKEHLLLNSSQSSLTLPRDFFQAHCRSKGGVEWENILAGIHRLERVKTRNSEKIKWNVLMFGFDSISRLHYQRKLPKTYEFLTKELGAVVLERYNIVGDGTPQALIPILTGYAEPELPDTLKRHVKSQYVNVYPFVWKNFSADGYVTAFAEDTPSVGIFTYRLNGFKEQPTDHFMRAFYVEAEKVYRKHKRLCLGNVTRHVVMLNWLRQLYDVYSETPKFAFGFHGELSHDDFNLVGVADEDLLEFLKGLERDGLLDHTFLLIMSDHGARFSSMRATVQGKQEERLPFFSITMPPAFREKFPRLAKNLESNSQRLTTPFDLHPTLLDILDPDSVPSFRNATTRGLSLFLEVPEERTCSQAGVDPHWCTCLTWESISLDSAFAKEVAQAVVDFTNDLIKDQKEKCAHLTLNRVTRAEQYQPNKDLLAYKGVLDKDGFVPDLTDKSLAYEMIYQVQYEVHPSDGIYEATVRINSAARTFYVTEKEISRVNKYGTQPHCIQEQLPHLMKYCYCKEQLLT